MDMWGVQRILEDPVSLIRSGKSKEKSLRSFKRRSG